MGITIDITPKDLKTIKDLLKQYLPNTLVWAFGSRVKFTAKTTSDLDLVAFISNEQELKFSLLKDAFEESSIPFRIDLHNWHELPETFHKNIETNYVVLQEDAKEELPNEWKKYKLGDLGFFFGGVTTIGKEDYGHGTPFLPYKNVYKNSKVNVNELELMNIRPQDIERRSAKYGDIFFTASSETPDEVAMSSVLLDDVENLTYNGFCKRYRLNDFNTLLPKYARYLFRDINFRREVYQVATGDIRFNISQESLAKIEIEIPDVATQAQLAEILMKLDDKIELNLQMNQTLEAMAQALFKEWFVNFNFPNFDGELENGLPKGWKVIELSKLISVKDGTHDSPKQKENGKFLITSKHLKNHFIDFESAYRISEEDFEKINKRSKVDKLDVLITMIGTVGNLYFVHDEVMDFAIKNIGLFKTSENPDLAYFLYFTISSKEISDYFIKRLAGSTQQYLTLDTLRQTPIVFPDDETLKLFNDFAKSIYHKIEVNSQNIQSLTQTRDTLLPKLMSGKICLNTI